MTTGEAIKNCRRRITWLQHYRDHDIKGHPIYIEIRTMEMAIKALEILREENIARNGKKGIDKELGCDTVNE